MANLLHLKVIIQNSLKIKTKKKHCWKVFVNSIKKQKGLNYFITNGFLESDDPVVIAKFLLETDGLDKAVIGEYLGEGDEKNIAIMHAFVDEMEFENTEFVDAMRRFLQSFRLPGEAQKIDRFMLKFAERYVLGNPGILPTQMLLIFCRILLLC